MDENKENKRCNLVARCTKQEKEKIVRKAKALGKSESKYIIDSCIAGTERKTDKLKKVIANGILIQEQINQVYYILDKYSSAIPDEMTAELRNQITKLGGIIKCQF